MTPQPPGTPRDPNDAWLDCACGSRHWGLGGAAGLLLLDTSPTPAVALQLRADWSHHGGTWGLPGGAIQRGEDPVTGALREAAEEAAIPAASVEVLATSVLDHGTWSYTTVLARVHGDRPVLRPLDGESADLAWVDLPAVTDRDLMPAFSAAWPALEALVRRSSVLLVDVANVVGARPDGWWRDRAGATTRLLTQLQSAARRGLPAQWFDLAADRVWPRVVAVTEGEGRASQPEDRPAVSPPRRGFVAPLSDQVQVRPAPGAGDDEIVSAASDLLTGGADPLVVATADRALLARLPHAVVPLGPGRLRRELAD